jgi:hypothetical protein
MTWSSALGVVCSLISSCIPDNCTEIYIRRVSCLEPQGTASLQALTDARLLSVMSVVEDRILEIAAELARIEDRRRLLLAELERLSTSPTVAARRRQLIAEILRTGPEQRSLFELPRDYNLLDEIRSLLNLRPQSAFPAASIKVQLQIPPSMEKSFYAALAKLANTGQIRRVGRALYQAARPSKTSPKKR